MNDIHFQGFWRMDWGLGNPNKTAALIALLMVAVWALAYVRRWGFWISITLFTGLGVCLIHTFSRGGLIAIFSGILPVLFFSPRPWPRNRIIATIFSILIMVGASIYLQAYERYIQGVVQEDRSISNRWMLWKAAPLMIRTAPNGWGIGNSGQAFTDWYQPLDHNESYRTLVSSHLTWLVELNWFGRLLYIVGWTSALLICWPVQTNKMLSISLGVWITFLISASFSSIAESLLIWIIPGIALLVATGIRIRLQTWPCLLWWLLPPAVAIGIVIFMTNESSSQLNIRLIGKSIILGPGEPGVWILVDPTVLGTHHKRILREYFDRVTIKSIALTDSVKSLPNSHIQKLIITGSGGSDQIEILKSKINISDEVILINPMSSPRHLNLEPESLSKFHMFLGEFSRTPDGAAWSQLVKTEHLVGIGDFLPNWPEEVFGPGNP